MLILQLLDLNVANRNVSFIDHCVSEGFELFIEVGDAETIDTPLGKLKVIPVRKVREQGEEGIEVWLASDYRNLPVRARFYDREGKMSGEQVVTEIKVSND